MVNFGRWVLCAFAAGCVARAASPHTAPLTIVLDFQRPHSGASVAAMKSELGAILKDTSLLIDWQTRGEAAGQEFKRLVLVRFAGRCLVDSLPAEPAGSGP